MTNKIILRAILNCKNNVFRDISISESENLEELHAQICYAYNLKIGQMASFYQTNKEWIQLDEIPLMSMDQTKSKSMSDYSCSEMISKQGDRLIFIYDFLEMWTFMIEFIKHTKENTSKSKVVLKYGERPLIAPDPEFVGEGGDISRESEKDESYDFHNDEFDNDLT
mgnify:CR=1 FL=1|tara:strand:+ start:1957 stop:2457 length:501 start_codon:yes stop_codon:yes gene_type:complete